MTNRIDPSRISHDADELAALLVDQMGKRVGLLDLRVQVMPASAPSDLVVAVIIDAGSIKLVTEPYGPDARAAALRLLARLPAVN